MLLTYELLSQSLLDQLLRDIEQEQGVVPLQLMRLCAVETFSDELPSLADTVLLSFFFFFFVCMRCALGQSLSTPLSTSLSTPLSTPRPLCIMAPVHSCTSGHAVDAGGGDEEAKEEEEQKEQEGKEPPD